jgi:multifunctional methyltransferase subunit TRM112
LLLCTRVPTPPSLTLHASNQQQLKCANGLPDAVDDAALRDEAFLRAFHHALLEVHLEEGALVCPETGRRFKVSKGIPNLLLNEDEV